MFDMLTEMFANCFIYVKLLLLVIILLGMGVAYAYEKVRHKWKCMALIPGPKHFHPLYGNLSVPIKASVNSKNWTYGCLQWLDQLAHEYGKDGVMRIWAGPLMPIVVLTRPDTVEKVLSSTSMTDKAFIYNIFKYYLGSGLGTSKNSRWKYNRKLLNPAFSYRVLQNFLPIINEQQNVLLDVIEKKLKENDGIIADIRPLMSMFVLDSICETAMGVKLESQVRGAPEYLQNLQKLFEVGIYMALRPWLWKMSWTRLTRVGREAAKYVYALHYFTDAIIQRRKLQITAGGAAERIDAQLRGGGAADDRQLVFLDILLQHHLKHPKQLSEYHVRSEVDTLMFAGHHTSGSSLVWTLHLIGSHPHVQRAIHAELDAVFADGSAAITLDHLRALKYLECVVKESLRLFPIAPLIARHNREEFRCGRYTIPRDTFVAIFISHIHRLDQYYDSPDKFMPERFQTDLNHNHDSAVKSAKSAYAFIPFSAGARNCVGQKFALMQQKAVLAVMLRKYAITAMDKLEDITIGVDFVLCAKSPIAVKFELRSDVNNGSNRNSI